MMEGGDIKINDVVKPDTKLEDINRFLDSINRSAPPILTLLDKLSKTTDRNEKILIINNLTDLYTPLSERITTFYNEQREERKIDESSANYLNLLHQFKNDIVQPPLILDLMKEDLLSGEDISEKNLNALKESVLGWESLSKNIINLENSSLKLERMNILDLVRNSVGRNTLNAKNKNIDIKLDNNTDCMVVVDQLQLEAVIDDIIKNAIKFTNKDGHINISSGKIEEKIEIKIKDDGVGIPENIRNLLLKNPVNSSTGTAGERGTGTGLLISLIIIKRMNGDIKIESEGEGKGTTVTIILPEAKE